MVTNPLSPEMADLIERAAELPHGLVFIEFAPLECAARTLEVLPEVLERAREALDEPADRALLTREYQRAVERRGSSPPSAPSPVHGPEDLIREAEKGPCGVQFVLCAPLETVAVTYAVHPFVVLGARELLKRRGLKPEEELDNTIQSS